MRLGHVILDRDGVLNREDPDGSWVIRAEDWEWESGALEALRLLTEAGARISVVTNQSCIGRGIASWEEVAGVHRHMEREAGAGGARIDAVFVCPHAPKDACSCRKPRPGLVRQALEGVGVPRSETVLIGDAQRDLEAGRQCGLKVMLVRTGRGTVTEASLGDDEVPVYDDLHSAVRALLVQG